MKKATAHGLRVSTKSGETLLYTSTKPISAEKERRLLRGAFGAAVSAAIVRRVTKAEKIHHACG